MQHGWCIAYLAKAEESISVELLYHDLVELRQEWLIKELNRNHNILHFWRSILFFKTSQNSMGVAEAISIAPIRIRCLVPAMVEAVLRLRGAMKVNDNLQASAPRPVNGSVKIGRRSFDIRAPRLDEAPVSYWNAYNVEACILDLLKVIKGYEVIPV